MGLVFALSLLGGCTDATVTETAASTSKAVQSPASPAPTAHASVSSSDEARAKSLVSGTYVESSRGSAGWISGPTFTETGGVNGTFWIGDGSSWGASFSATYSVTSPNSVVFKTQEFRDASYNDRVLPALVVEIRIESETEISIRVQRSEGGTGFVSADALAFISEYTSWRTASKVVADASTFAKLEDKTFNPSSSGFSGSIEISTFAGLRGKNEKFRYPGLDSVAIDAYGAEDFVIPFYVRQMNTTDASFSTSMTYRVSATGVDAGQCFTTGCSVIDASGTGKTLNPQQSSVTPGYIVLRGVATPTSDKVDISKYIDTATVTIAVAFDSRPAGTYHLTLVDTPQGPALAVKGQ